MPPGGGSGGSTDGDGPDDDHADQDGTDHDGADHDDLYDYDPILRRVMRVLRWPVGIVVAVALLIPTGGWLIDQVVVRLAGGQVEDALGDDVEVTRSLRLVRSVDCEGRSRSGSAFAIQLDGRVYLLTNRHVVERARSSIVQPLDGGQGAAVVEHRLAVAADVAVLVVAEADLPPGMPAGEAPTLGEPVRVVGFPAARPAYREGRIDRVEPGRMLLALEVGAGASGSPVLDVDGQVVGQVYARTSDDRGVATPLPALREAVRSAQPAAECP